MSSDLQKRIRTLPNDLVAGLVNGVASVPSSMTTAALAGVNPVYGLYTSIAAPIAGSALVSAQLMQISTTSASALAAGQAIAGYPLAVRDEALFLLTLLVGLFLAVFGLLRFGRLVHFVSHAVMTGFLTGVAAVLVLDQLAPLVGYSPRGDNEIMQSVDLLRSPAQFSVPTILTGVLALALAFGLARTRLATLAPLIAVQGAGVSQSVENPGGRPVNPSRDMVAQGVANAASGLLSGIPAGGSVGQTALNVSLGARSRWAGILGGVWMLAIVLLFPALVGRVPMAVLAALMIQAGLSAINTREVRSIWRTGGAARTAILVTFVATLVLSVPVAVAVGVGLTVVLFLSSSASDVRVRERVTLPDGRVAEADPPKTLLGEEVTVLDVYGSLFFAGARTLREALPSPAGATRPVVVLRLRGRTRVGATLIEVLDDYADDLAAVGGRLYLSGVDEDVSEQLRGAAQLELGRSVHVVPAGDVVGDSTAQAVASARGWLGSTRADPPRMKRA